MFTAFGERISGPATLDRFGYVGAFGYQSHAEFPFLHVGARYYDPASGRFLQRDPIGIRGGLNTYAYSRLIPTWFVDPFGLTVVDDIEAGAAVGTAVGGTAGGIAGAVAGVPGGPPAGLVGAGVGAMAGAGVGAVVGAMCGLFYWMGNEIADFIFNGPGPGLPQEPEVVLPPGNSCFVEDTRVAAADGNAITVGELLPGAEVLSGRGETCHVTAVHRALSDELVWIHLNGEVIGVSPEHPFWVMGCGWLRAGELQSGDLLESIDGMAVPVLAVRRERSIVPWQVFNISVDGNHVYYVGQERVRVHNKPP